jgi:hypothetical protein
MLSNPNLRRRVNVVYEVNTNLNKNNIYGERGKNGKWWKPLKE